MAAAMKLRRVSRSDVDIRLDSVLRLANATHTLCIANQKCSDAVKLSPHRIRRSNATGSIPFSRAFCETREYDVEFLFGDVFQRGMKVITDYLYQRTLPADKMDSFFLIKLLDVIGDEKRIKFDREKLSRPELAVTLTNHLFDRLGTIWSYIIDRSGADDEEIECACNYQSCKMTGHYGDTSIGNKEVWHGKVDIFINNDLIVQHLGDPPRSHGENESSPGEQDFMEVKVNSSILPGNSQITAQTIVFSFLQKRMHPERGHFLTPCIGVQDSMMVVMFYDSEHDVLLESSHIPLFHTSGPEEYEFNDTAIIVSWLTVNYKYLCSGLTNDMKSCKGDFFYNAEEKLKIYEEKLQLGNVALPHSVQNIHKKSLQFSSFLEEHETKLVKIIHREIREQGTFE